MRGFILVMMLLPFAAGAQTREETLADIRQQLMILNTEVSGLKQELSTTGMSQSGLTGGSALQRIDEIEAALVRLTSKTEALEFRINSVVADGTNRIGDLEFRLVELEGGDLGALGQTPVLGGSSGAVVVPGVLPTPVPGAGASSGAQLAANEQADFDRAREVLAQGDFRAAADLFATFTQTYTGGPLTGEAHFLRGEALTQLGETALAARAYLESFSGAPNGPRAAEALLKLGISLSLLGQTPEACVTLAEVGVRFPESPAAVEAANAKASMGCT